MIHFALMVAIVFGIAEKGATLSKQNAGITDLWTETIPVSETLVNFCENQITVIPRGYFHANFTNLFIIQICKNPLSTVEDFAFEEMDRVTILKLQENKLSTLRRHMFR